MINFRFLTLALATVVVLSGCLPGADKKSTENPTPPAVQPATNQPIATTTSDNSTVDDELKNLDATINSVNGSDFDTSTLSDGELGL